MGKKADGYFRFRKYRIDATFTGMSDQPDLRGRARRSPQAVLAPFEAGEVDQVQLVYTRFISAGTQVVEEVTLMPLDPGGLGIADRAADAVADGGRVRGARRSVGELRVRARRRRDPHPPAARATSRRASSPPSSTPRRRSTRRASGR